MKKKTSIGIMFILMSTSFFITTVTAADESFNLIVDGPTEGQAYVEMTWTLTVVGGTPPYVYSGDWGDSPPGGPAYAWCTLPTYDNPLIVSHTYTEEGEYLAMFRVRDTNNNHDEVEITVTIGPPPFMVEIIPPDIAEFWVNDNLQWDCNVIGGTPPYTYNWDFGDDTPINHNKAPIHAFAKPTLPPDEWTTVYLEVTCVTSDPSGPHIERAEDWEFVEVFGYDMAISVTKNGLFQNYVLRGSWPVIFYIKTTWYSSLSNTPSGYSDDWHVDWTWWQWDPDMPPNGGYFRYKYGDYDGPRLPKPGQDWHEQWIILRAPHEVGVHCPFEAILTSIPAHDYNPDNDVAWLDIWTY